MTHEAASEKDFGITPALCDIRTHPCAEAFLEWTLRVTAQMVRPRRIWADALNRCADTIADASTEAICRFEARMKREPFGFKIWTALLGDEKTMVTMADCSQLLERFEDKFPN
jgi:hypothetical protein